MRTRIKIDIAHWHWTFCLSCVLARGRNYITHGLVQDPCASQAVHLKGFIVVSLQRGPYMVFFLTFMGSTMGPSCVTGTLLSGRRTHRGNHAASKHRGALKNPPLQQVAHADMTRLPACGLRFKIWTHELSFTAQG